MGEESLFGGFFELSRFNSRTSDGLKEDIMKIIQKFVDADTLRFETFVEIWKEMKFSLIFIGRPMLPELAEFTEEALHISKKFLTDISNSIHMRVAALYLLYAIAYRQPIKYFAKVHVVAEQCDSLLQLRSHARQYGHFDILYVLGRLLIDGLLEFHIAERQYGMEKALRKHYEMPSGGVFNIHGKATAPLPKVTPIQKTLASLTQLEECSKRYHSIKCRMEGDRAHAPPASLCYVDTHLPLKLAQNLRSITNGVPRSDITETASEEATPSKEGESSAPLQNRRQEIRILAQKKTNTLPQHLITVKGQPGNNLMDIDSEKSSSEGVVLPPKKNLKKKDASSRKILERRRQRYGLPEFKKFDEV